jgi:hypothetical protein
MKIETSIKARREKTVRLTTPKGNTIVFSDDGSGHLVADVTDQADLAFILSRSEFSPVDEADFVQAESLIRNDVDLTGPASALGLTGQAGDTGEDDLPDDTGDVNAAPIEVVTLPKPGKPAKAAKAAK